MSETAKALSPAHVRLQSRLDAFERKASDPKKQREAWGMWGELRDVVPQAFRQPVKTIWDLVLKGSPPVQLRVILNEVRKALGLPELPVG